MTYLAHISEDNRIQPLASHLTAVAKMAEEFGVPSGLGKTCYIAGLLHDVGKGCRDFQTYLASATSGDSVTRAFPHSRGGARFVLEIGNTHQETQFSQYTAEIIAATILSHHSSHDFVDDGNNIEHCYGWYMDRVLYSDAMQYAEISAFANSILPVNFDSIFSEACLEIETLLGKQAQTVQTHAKTPETAEEEMYFAVGMIVRTVLSCVVKADHIDTAEFVNGKANAESDRSDFASALTAISNRYANSEPTPINEKRQMISDTCAEFGRHHGEGIYRLEVPTGSGKTMATQRLALECMTAFNKSRIINVMPMLSIIEQNAQDIRNVVGKYCEVQEFHSDVIIDDMDEEAQIRYRNVADTWSASYIITTLVQFLETLFRTNSRNLKRFSALQDAIIVIDEVQSVPPNMLSLFNSAVNYLAEVCHCLVILCSATQPALQDLRHPIHYEKDPSIVAFDETLWPEFRRTNLIPVKNAMTIDEVAGFALDHTEKNMLIVCNTRSETKKLYDLLKTEPKYECIKIDTNLCPAHRKKIIAEVREKLEKGKRIICISTQVIEAGVDVSFDAGIRIMAGLDSAIQTAGRVSRHGKNIVLRNVWMINLIGENLSKLKEIQESKTASLNYFEKLRRSQEIVDLSEPEIVTEYYRRKYAVTDINPDYVTTDDGTIYEMLSTNKSKCVYLAGQINEHFLRYAFKSAGENFKVFDDASTSVIVPYERGKEIISELNSDKAENPFFLKKLMKEAEQFSVKVFDYQKQKLETAGAIYSVANGKALALTPNAYDAFEGLKTDGILHTSSDYIV